MKLVHDVWYANAIFCTSNGSNGGGIVGKFRACEAKHDVAVGYLRKLRVAHRDNRQCQPLLRASRMFSLASALLQSMGEHESTTTISEQRGRRRTS
jgi:hypothetical protein